MESKPWTEGEPEECDSGAWDRLPPLVRAKRGNFCRDCGAWLEEGQPHSYALGPRAGHYCFGCEPAGVPVTTINHLGRQQEI
jgi:hypothetical protein